MLAELDHLEGHGARWSFALGCTRAVLASGRTKGPATSLLIALVLLVAAGTGAGIWLVSPLTRVFAVMFAVMLACCGGLAIIWPRAAGRRGGAVAAVVVLAGVAGCVSLVLYGARRYPRAVEDPSHAFSLILAAGLAGCVAMALLPSPAAARRYGVPAGILTGLLWAVGGMASDRHAEGLSPVIWLGSLAFPMLSGVLAARSGGLRARTGVAAGLWSGLVAGLALFVAGMTTVYASTGWYQRDPATVELTHARGLPDAATWAVGDNLGGSVMMMVLLPFLCLAMAAFGSAAAPLLGRDRRRLFG